MAAWKQLAALAVSPNPFAEPDFVLPAMRAWGVSDLGVLVVRNGADWLAAVPVRSVRYWRGVPGPCLAAWRHPYCYLGTPLVTDADTQAILAMLVRRGLHVGSSLALDWIDADGPLARPLASALALEARAVVVEEFERAALYRRPTPGHLEQAMSFGHIEEYRRKFRSLEREVGALTLRDDSNDPAAYRRFLELERSGCKGAAGKAMACRPGHSAFFIELCERFARSGRLRLLSLASERRTIAMRSDFVAGDTSFNFKVAFDEEFARFSPGIQLFLANIERFHASARAWSDSCADRDNATLNRLWPERRRLQSIVATRREASGALAYATWRCAAAARPIRRKLTRPPNPSTWPLTSGISLGLVATRGRQA